MSGIKRMAAAALISAAFLTNITFARAAGLSIYIDGQEIPTEANTFIWREETNYSGISKEVRSSYYMDVKPEEKNGTVFVPVRTLSKYFNAEISWEKPCVLLELGETSVTLTIGDNTVQKNGLKFVLENAPYIKNGRTMVPLRLISEAFGYTVNYSGGKVDIVTPPLSINGRTVASVQSETAMFMGGSRSECSSNFYANILYDFLQSNSNVDIAEPEYYGERFNGDIGNYYFRNFEISFMESEGLEGNVIRQYHIYTRDNDIQKDIDDIYAFPVNGTDLGYWLIHDVSLDNWYQVEDDFQFNWRNIDSTVVWNVLSNAV